MPYDNSLKSVFKLRPCCEGYLFVITGVTNYSLKGHSQLVRMCIRYYFSANLHITTARSGVQK